MGSLKTQKRSIRTGFRAGSRAPGSRRRIEAKSLTKRIIATGDPLLNIAGALPDLPEETP
jgi:hypothetical protein